MNLTRRGFLKSCLALAAAPAIVRAESIMRMRTPPQEIVLPSLEFCGAQVERAMAPSHMQSCDYIGSVWIRKPGGSWMREVIEMKSHQTSVMPIMRVDCNGLSVESGGELVRKNISQIIGDPTKELYAKATFPTPNSHMTIGDPKGIGFYGSCVSITQPATWPVDQPLHYPLVNNFDVKLPSLTKKLLERI